MLRDLRHGRLLEHLRLHGPSDINALAAACDASVATTRRDLDHLSSQGLVERTWGGARLVAGAVEDDPFEQARLDQADAKRAIAECAARLVPEGASVVLDIGTTTHYLAELLRERELTVITASLPVFETLRDAPGVHIVLLGGEHSARYQCLEGTLTADSMARFTPDLAFLGCSGVTERGQVRDTSNAQVVVKRAIAASAQTTVLLADHSKFPGHGSEVALDLSDLDVLVCDQAPGSACPVPAHVKVVTP